MRTDIRGTPRLTIDERLTNIKAGSLLRDLSGRQSFTGRADVIMRLVAAGADAESVNRSLDGIVVFTLTNGTIEGANIPGTLCRALGMADLGTLKREDIIRGLLRMILRQPSGTKRTDFSELKGTMKIKDGVVYNDDFVLKSPLLRVEGRGKLNLANRRLDYLVTAALVEGCAGHRTDLRGVPVLVYVGGPLSELKVTPKLAPTLVEILRRRKGKK